MHNALRHAGARSLWLRLAVRGERLDSVVSDDGSGFAGDGEPRTAGGLGLSGMRDRAAAVGGRLHLEERRGGGATVRVEVPWPPAC